MDILEQIICRLSVQYKSYYNINSLILKIIQNSQFIPFNQLSVVMMHFLPVLRNSPITQFINQTLIKLLQKQKMGNCSCDAVKNHGEEFKHELIESQELATQPNQYNSNSKQNTKTEAQSLGKRKCKNPIIIKEENIDTHDNVQYDSEAQISEADVAEIRKAISKHFILSQLNQEEIGIFLTGMKPCSARKDTYIFKQGDKSGSYYIILEGVCQIQINGKKKKSIGFGDSFGDLGIIYNAPRSASVFAVTDCQMVEINRQTFKKVMEDINQLHQKENKKFLSVLSFFKDLTEVQKNAIASTCLTETYEEGQVIFNLGDDANSFYIIKEGTVFIKERKEELKSMDCFGEACILTENELRKETMISKTKCKIISMSRQNIKSSLGDSLKNVIKRNMIWKILNNSKLIDHLDNNKLKSGVDKSDLISFKKGEVVLRKGVDEKGFIYVLVQSELKGDSIKYLANSVIQMDEIVESKPMKIRSDLIAVDDGMIAKVAYEFESASSPNHQIYNKEHEARQDKNMLEKKMQINDFSVVKKLREGNFGRVYACWNNKTEKLYAVKVLDRAYVEKSSLIQYIMNEEEILRTIPKHPFVVRFHKLIKDANFIYLIMEYIEGEDLFDVITKLQTCTFEQTAFMVAQMVLFIEHLHSNRIIYRDLKPENIMMNTDGYLTLIDMGTSKQLKIERRFKTNTIIGTPHYMAPQIITGKGYSFLVDLWSIGIITYELLCGKLPFGENSEDPYTIYEQIMSSNVKYPRNFSKISKLFIERLLSRSPMHRMGNGYEELKKNKFFEGLDWSEIITKQKEALYHPSEEVKITKRQIDKAIQKEKNKCPGKFIIDRVAQK